MASDPVTFPTEAARLAAREQYIAIQVAIYCEQYGDTPSPARQSMVAEAFDSVFPPIAPPKMVPTDARVCP